MRKLTFLLLAIAILAAGCSDNVIVQGANNAPPPAPATPTGDILVRFDLQPRIVLNTITGFRFTVLDVNGKTVFGPVETARLSEVRLTPVPITAARLRIELLRNGVVVGLFEAAVTVTEGQTTAVDNVNYSDVVPAAQLAIQPPRATLSAGQTASFVVISRPDDPNPQDVTTQAVWSSSNPAVLRVDGPGQVTALSSGVVTLTATFGQETATAEITVTNAVITALRFDATPGSVMGQQQFRLLADFSDGTSAEVTQQATWSVENTGVASVSNTVPTRGVVRTVTLGTTNLTASLGSLSATRSITTIGGGTLLSRRGTNDGPGNNDSAFSQSGLQSRNSSSDGRFVVFTSAATDLLPPGPVVDTNGAADVYLRDRQNNVNILVSVNTTGLDSGAGDSSDPVITPDGRFVYFQSDAPNLVPGGPLTLQIYRRDLQSNTTILVSRNADGVPQPANDDCLQPRISADGAFVAFTTDATNMPLTGANVGRQIVVRNLVTGAVITGSVDPAGAVDPSFQFYDLSDNGAVLVFDGEDTSGPNLRPRILARNLPAGPTRDVSVTQTGALFPFALAPMISGDGNEVIFFGQAPPELASAFGCFVKNLSTGETRFLTSDLALAMSSDARFLATIGGAVIIFGFGEPSIFDRQTGVRVPALVNSAGQSVSLGIFPFVFGLATPAISPDGNHVFVATDVPLDPLGNGGFFQIYQMDNPLK